MNFKVVTILLSLTVFNFAAGQIPQSPEDINKYKLLKIKSVRTSIINYDTWAASPEGQVLFTNHSTSLRLYDSSGRLVREYAGSGTNYMRNIYYDSNGRIDNELWLYSKLQTYPEFITPRSDSDYNDVYKRIKYHFNVIGRLDSSTIDKGNKTFFQYNDSGYLISLIEINPAGFVVSFQISKYGYGVNWGKVLYKVVNNNTQTTIYEYEYQDRLLVKKKITYDSGKKSTTYYDEKEQETVEELFDKADKLVARFEFKYNKYGLEKITSYRLPDYNSWNEPRNDKLRISTEEIYSYETY